MKSRTPKIAAFTGIRFPRLLPLAIAALCSSLFARAGDFSIPAGGSLPAVADLDTSGTNTVTLFGNVSLAATYNMGARQTVFRSDGAARRTITAGGSSYFFRLAGKGTWGFDNIILTGGSSTGTVDGGAIYIDNSAGAGTTVFEGSFIIRDNKAARYGGGIAAAAGQSIVFSGDIAFERNTGVRGGGLFFQDTGSTVFKGAAVFTSNTATAFGGGIVSSNAGSIVVFESSATFYGNRALVGNGGGLYTYGSVEFRDSARFELNTTSTYGGALYFQTTAKTLIMPKNAVVTSNTALSHAGGIYIRGDYYIGGSSTFSNNYAGGDGGAIYMVTGDGTTVMGTFDASLGDIVFKGNTHRDGTRNAIYMRTSAAANTKPTLVFNTGTGGAGHNIIFQDPIVGSAANGFATITQDGAGTLIFDTYTSSISATTSVNSGTFRLTRGAVWGSGSANGVFTVAAPATLSGNGIVRANTITLAVGSTLEVIGGGVLRLEHEGALSGATGLNILGSGTISAGGALAARTISAGAFATDDPEAPSAPPPNTAQVLAFDAGTPLTLENGGVIHIDLFGSGTSDLLRAGTLAIAGTGTVNLAGASDGAYKIITTTNDISAAGLTRTVNGAAITARYTADLRYENGGTETWVDFTTKNLAQNWTGAGALWKNSTTSDANWTDGASSRPEQFFLNGDRVFFGDTGAGVVTVDAAGVRVADMTVDTAANYTFAGAGGITSATGISTANLAPAATGRLVKKGTGTLGFENAANDFSEGIGIEGGVLAFTQAGQIGDGGKGILFTNSGTLRAVVGTETLGNNLILNDGVSKAVVEVVAGGTLTHLGRIQGAAGTFVKTGGGVFVLASDNSSGFEAAAQVESGAFLLADGAKIGGTVHILNNALFGGSGSAGSIAVASGGVLQIGLPGASGTLYAGALDLAAGATLNYTLLSGNQSSRLQLGAAPVLAGGSVADNYSLNLSEWIAGTYTLGNIVSLENATFKLKGDLLNARQLYTTATAGGLLEITLLPTANAVLTWRGTNAAGPDAGIWNSSAENWGAGATSFAFADSDAVVFDDNVAAPAWRTVAIANAMIVSDMTVSGSGDYRLEGAGGITGDAAGAVSLGGSSRLTKTGTGTLTFANTGGNLFKGGIAIGSAGESGGVIAFDRADQLAVNAGAAIVFHNSGTLRALAGITTTGTLRAAIVAGDGANATFDTGAHEVAYSGSLSAAGAGGVFAKVGSGTFRVTGTSVSAGLAVDVREGAMLLGAGVLDAPVRVRGGALFGGAGSAAGSGGVRVDAGATLRVGMGGDNDLLHIAGLELADGSTIAGRGVLSGSIAINASVAAGIAGSEQLTISSTTGGAGTLVKGGAGTLVFSSSAALGHATTSIDSGVVALRGFDGLPSASGTHVFVLNGGWLDLSEGGAFDPGGDNANNWAGLVLRGNSGRVIGANDRITLRAGDAGFDIGSPDDPAGQGVFVVVDAGADGVAAMTGANHYAGYTLLKSGTLRVAADAQLGIVSETLYREIIFDGGALAITANGFSSGRAIELRAGGGAIDVSATQTGTWGGELSGSGALVKEGAGMLVLKGEAGHTGGTVVRSGTLQGDSASLRGSITNNAHLVFAQASGGDFSGTIVGASGVVTKNGAGALSLSGGITAAVFNLDAGTLIVPGVKTLATAQFNNNGATLRIGKAGGASAYGRVTIAGNYRASSDAALVLGLRISGAVLEYDQLHVTGDADGRTTVSFGRLIAADSSGGELLPDDIITWGGLAAPDAFVQSPDSIIEFGGIKYTWEINADGRAGSWVADPIASAPAMLGAGASALLMGKTAFASLGQRMLFERFESKSHAFALWLNGVRRHDKMTAAFHDGARTDTHGVQIGGDWGSRPAEDRFMAVGVFYDYAQSDLRLRGGAANTDATSNGLGVYYTEFRGAWYMDMILRMASLDFQIDAPGRPSFSTKGQSYGFSAELGRLITLRKNWTLQPQIQVAGQHLEIDKTFDSYGRPYLLNNIDSVDIRAGLGISRSFPWSGRRTLTAYARASVACDIDGVSEIYVSNRAYRSDLGGVSAMIDFGLAIQVTRLLNLNTSASGYGGGKTEGYSFNLGISSSW